MTFVSAPATDFCDTVTNYHHFICSNNVNTNTLETVQWYSLWARHNRLIQALTVALSLHLISTLVIQYFFSSSTLIIVMMMRKRMRMMMIIIIITRRVWPPNGGRNLHRPQQPSPSGLSHRPLAAGRTLATPGESFRRGEDSSPSYVNALSPPIAGERVGVEGWGGNGHLLEAYSTNPHASPKVWCAVSEIWGVTQ